MPYPDAYIRLYHKDFLDAVKGQPSCVKAGYLAAICHYMAHDHCVGLPNDNGFLQSICEIFDAAEWSIAKPIIFGRFFKQDKSGFWQQQRAAEVWGEMCADYDSRCKRTEKAREKRWPKFNIPKRGRLSQNQ